MVARKRGGQRAHAAVRQCGTAARCAVELSHVLSAVDSLYKDQIKPVCRILRKRIVEMSILVPPRRDTHWGISVEDLRVLCESCRQLVVEIDDTGDWAALSVGQPRTFIDVYGLDDPYGEELWSEMTAHCTGQLGASLALPGGRYACAVALGSRNLPCLAGRSLGEIAHIVQLGLSSRKLLGYSNGAIVPYSQSQSMMKEQCAKSCCPCSSARDPMLVANWEIARSCLWQILQISPGGQLPLPNVKRLFRSRFHLDLSETAFGYSKVSELLQDRHFQDICEVQLRGHGYVVIQTRQTAYAAASVISLSQSLVSAPRSAWPSTMGFDTVPKELPHSEFPQRVDLCEPLSPIDAILHKSEPISLVPSPATGGTDGTWCLTPDTVLALSQDGYRAIVKNGFIQVNKPQTPKLPTSRSMPAGLSRDSDEDETSSEAAEVELDTSNTSIDEECNSDTADTAANPLRELLSSLPRCVPEPVGAFTPGGMCEQAKLSALRTPGRKKSARRHVMFCVNEPLEDPDCSPISRSVRTPAQMFPMTPITPITDYDEPHVSAARAASIGSPLALLEPDECVPAHVHEDGRTCTMASDLPNLLTPTTMSKQGIEITNTFLNAKRAPPTPFIKQEARRSKSVG